MTELQLEDAHAEIDRLRERVEELTDKALRFDLDQAGIAQREREAVELVELRARVAELCRTERQALHDLTAARAEIVTRDAMMTDMANKTVALRAELAESIALCGTLAGDLAREIEAGKAARAEAEATRQANLDGKEWVEEARAEITCLREWVAELEKRLDFACDALTVTERRRDELKSERNAARADVVKANEQAEHFEREWYLRGDELDAARAEAEALRKELAEFKLLCHEQATQGVFVEHDCPAMFACAAILAELGPEYDAARAVKATEEERIAGDHAYLLRDKP